MVTSLPFLMLQNYPNFWFYPYSLLENAMTRPMLVQTNDIELKLLTKIANQAPHHNACMGRTIRMKIPQTYAQFYIFSPNQPSVEVRGRTYVLADWHRNRCCTLQKHSASLDIHSVWAKPYKDIYHNSRIPLPCS